MLRYTSHSLLQANCWHQRGTQRRQRRATIDMDCGGQTLRIMRPLGRRRPLSQRTGRALALPNPPLPSRQFLLRTDFGAVGIGKRFVQQGAAMPARRFSRNTVLKVAASPAHAKSLSVVAFDGAIQRRRQSALYSRSGPATCRRRMAVKFTQPSDEMDGWRKLMSRRVATRPVENWRSRLNGAAP